MFNAIVVGSTQENAFSKSSRMYAKQYMVVTLVGLPGEGA